MKILKNKNKTQTGITLVALIITIIVLLILAVVTIAAISGDSIINHAENARDAYRIAQEEENSMLQYYQEYLDAEAKKAAKVALRTAKTAGTAFERDTVVEDAYGNTLKVPAGFKIASDSADNVTGGVVIEDAITGAATIGSQFVWIPVGTIYTSANQETSTTITLSRYTFANNGTPAAQGDAVINTYWQELATSTYGNSTAKNLSAFLSSVSTNGGYYLGRYEARTNSTTARTSSSKGDISAVPICKSTNAVYNYVTQIEASSLSQAMYTGKNFTSDLVNSYAWDTAIVFLQTFDDRQNKTTPYAYQTSYNTSLVSTGALEDEICKVNGMSSNCREWTTETSSVANLPCTGRGGVYDNSYYYASFRNYSSTSDSSAVIGFRPLLYW